MKKFIYKSIVLIGPLFVFIICVIFSKYDKEFAYKYLQKDYAKAGWIYDRLYSDKVKIDIAFLGTSHTLNAVNDSLITSILNQKYNSKTNIANLSISHTGRNLHYVLAKDLMSQKQVKTIVVEIREKETRTGHFAFPIIAEAKDIVFPEMFFNITVFRDVVTAFKSRIEYNIAKFTKTVYKNDYMLRKFGFYVNPEKISEIELEHRSTRENLKFFYLREKLFDIEFLFGKKYMEKICLLAKDNQVQILFLYLPFYKTKFQKPYLYDFYKQYGKIMFPPKRILNNPKYWSNLTHLNKEGSTVLSKWVADELVRLKQFN